MVRFSVPSSRKQVGRSLLRILTLFALVPNHYDGPMPRLFLFRWMLLFSSLFACAQAQSAAASQTTTDQAPAVVAFTLDFPGSQPDHYAIRISSAGPNHYESSGRLTADSDVTDSFDFDFTISAETRARVFSLAAKAGYFQNDLNSRRKHMAFTGKKTLRYTDATRTGEATYNYSDNPAVEDLTSLFQNLSATLEFGHRLDYDHRYQKLALDEELKRMLEMTQSNMLTEVTAIQPILEKIVADQSVINVARARAQRLLAPADRR